MAHGAAQRAVLAAAAVLSAVPALAQAPTRSLGQIRLNVVGVSATLDPLAPVVPKNTASAVRIVVRSGDSELTGGDVASFLGTAGFKVEALLSGPGLPFTTSLPQLDIGDPLPADPLMLPLPPLRVGGDYSLSHIRITVGGESVLEVEPSEVTLKVIDQILVTSVKTRPLSLDEIKEKGIVLDSDDYLGFEFTMALALDSKATTFTFPVVFNRDGVAIPPPITDPLKMPNRELDIPTPFGRGGSGGIYATMLTVDAANADVPLTTPKGEPIRIPGLLVIPGQVGYLKQFFSAQLFVANGAPVGSGLNVRDVTGTISLPLGPDGIPSSDDPLALPEINRDGQTILQPRTMDVKGVGPDAVPGTADDVSVFAPAEQGQAEFLLRGEAEGFHTIDFDISATLEGLPVGPVKVKGKASGGVLVRNPFFDMTFTVPSVVRSQEQFKVFVNVTNIGKGAANLVDVELDSAAMSGLDFGTYPDGHVETPSRRIDTIGPGDTRTLEFLFRSQKTGQVVATYLKLDPTGGGAGTGKINFTIGVGERGVPLSPDTLVLPTAVDMLPQPLVDAAMRVLGQGWSIAGASPGTLPAGVIKTTKAAVTVKALALAEAGLRVQLGQDVKSAIRDLIFDFYGGDPVDPGFDQLLRQTEAGRDLARAIGAELAEPVGSQGPIAYERDLARLAASGPDFLSFAATGADPIDVTVSDALGHRLASGRMPFGIPEASIPGGVIVPAGEPATAPLLGVITAPSTSPYTFTLSGPGDFVVTYPRGDGTFERAPISTGGPAQVVVDFSQPDTVVVRQNLDGQPDYEAEETVSPSDVVRPEGPHLLTANVIGPETLQGGNPLGLYAALLFDRVVDPDSAAVKDDYAIPSNEVQAAKRQLSGRLVFAALAQPEGPYVPTTVTASGVADTRGVLGPTETVPLGSRLDTEGAVVIGRVVSADGTPVAAGFVYYSNHQSPNCDGNGGTGARVSAVPLTSDGRYELRYVRRDPCGRPFAVSTTDPISFFERSITAYVRHAGERMVLDLALLGKGSVAGTVRDLTGAAVPGALVVALSGVDQNTGGNATTDGQGQYTISNVTVGPVTVKAGKGTGIGSSSGRIDRAGTTATVDVNIDYGGAVRISGVVRRTQGGVTEVVPGALVVDTMEGGPVGYAWTDNDGKYVLDNMPVGPFTVSSNLGGNATGNGFKGADLDVDLLIDAGGNGGGSVFGVVKGVVRLPDGSPAAGAVVAQDISDSVVFDGTLSGPDGTFALAGIKAGDPVQIGAITTDRTRKGYTYATVDAISLEATGVVITLSGMGTLEFQVLNASGLPVAGQEVSLFDQSSTMGGCHNPCGCTTLKTGPDGRVRFPDRPLGGITAQAIQFGDGFVDVAQGQAQIRRDGEIGFGVIQLRGTGTVTGKVIPPEGVFATGGEVRVSSYQFENDGLFTCGLVLEESHRGPVDLVSNEFRFPKVNVGPVYVTVTHPLFPSVAASGNLTAAGQVLHFDLPLVDTISGVLSGTVYLPDGTTPAGAGVEVTASGPVAGVMVKTDADGKYRFAKVFPQGTYSITATDPRTGGLSLETVYLRAREDQVHDQRLKGRGTVRVRVVDGSDQPVASAFVSVNETDFPRRSYEGAVEAANQGVAVMEGVFEGPFSIAASDAYGRGGRASGTLARPGDTVDVTVRLTAVGTVRGRFLMPDRLTAVPFGVVRLLDNGRVIGQTTTPGAGDDVGAFSFDYVPAGDVQVEAQDPLTLRTGAAGGRIDRDGQEVVLDVVAQGLGAVQGVVRSRRNGGTLEPEAGAHVVVESAGYQSATTTDASGRYVVEGIPEGAVTATASLNGFLRGTATGSLTGDGSVLDVDVVLQDSARVTGTVLKAGTTDTPGPVSPVTFQSGSFRLVRSSDEQGRFQFDRVPVGHADLFVDVPDSLDEGRASVDVTPGEMDVPIVLNGVGTLSGVALDFTGNPVPGYARILAQGAVPFAATKAVGTNGSFLVGQVPAGPFAITMTGLGDFPLSGSATFTVLPDETKQVEVRLQPSGTVTGLVLRPDAVTPALGADVTVQLTPNRGQTIVQALANGRFTLPNVPLGDLQVQVRDNLTAGVARKGPLTLSGDLLDFGTIVLDDTPVSVTAVDPAEGASGVQPGQIVRVTFTDPLASSGGVEVRDGTQTLPATATLSLDGLTLSLRGPWPDARDLTVVATTNVRDVYGRNPAQAFTSHFRTADLSPPFVTSIAPAFGTIQIDVGSVVTVVFNEPLGDATSLGTLVTVAGPGGAAVAGTTTSTVPGTVTFAPLVPLAANASYTVTVAGAVDVTGNRQTNPFVSSFKTTDTVPPGLTLQDPPDGSWVRSPRPQFYLSMSDALSGLDMSTAVLAIDAQTVPAVRGSNTLTFVPTTDLAEGAHSLGASVRDNGTNLTTLASTFRVDSVPPTVPVVTGLSEGQVLRGPVTLSATATDASSGLARVELLSDGVVFLTLAPPALQATYGTSGLSEGPHAITARAIDVAGNASASTPDLHVVVDNQVLTLAITTPAAGTVLGDSVLVRATASEPVTSVEFSVGTVVVTDTAAPYEARLPLAAIPEGSAIVKAKAVPPVGDPAFAQVQIVVDRTPPSAPDGSKITAVSDGTYAQVQGAAGAVEAGLRLDLTDLATSAGASAYAAGNGAFGTSIQAAPGHTLSLTALDAAGNRSAATTVPVTARPTGTVRGRVLQPDGTTGVPGASVTLAGVSTLTSGTDGGFSFAGVPLGNYTLEARVGGRLRAQVSPIGVSAGDQVVEQDLVLVGVGTVTGLVTEFTGAAVAGAHVTLNSQAPRFGGGFAADTDGSGRYTITDVPVGGVTLSVTRGADRADGVGTVPAHGATVTVDLRLVSAAVNLPVNLVDGNGLTWTVGPSGSVGAPWGMFDATSPRLSLVQGGTAVTFSGSGPVGASEEGYREIVVRQSGLAGLDVTRKVYVPNDGYFVRHVDTLSNPGPAPVTVDLKVELGMGPSWPQATRILATSSGDGILDASDGWAVLDDDVDDANVFDGSWHFAPLPVVFRGPGGTAPAVLAFDAPSRQVTSRWNAITVAPGQSVSVLYAYTAQADRTRATATATRLASLPPEELQGLAAGEAAAITNFQVPADLVSALAPLPLLDGAVSGQLFAWDGVTPSVGAPFTSGVFRSRSAYYGRPLALSVDAAGAYALRADLTRTDAGKRLVPREAFDVTFTTQQIGTPSASASGSFAITGNADLTTTAGRTVRASSSYSSSYGPEAAVDGDLGTAWYTASGDAANRGGAPYLEVVLAADATIRQVHLRGIRGNDSYTIRRARVEVRDAAGTVQWSTEADLPLPLRDADVSVPAVVGRSVRVVSLVDVSSTPGLAELEVLGDGMSGTSGRARADVSFTGTAILGGRVLRADGSPVGGGPLTIATGGQSRQFSTDAGGNFLLLHVPPATYTLTAVHPQGQASAVATVVVSANQTLTRDLVFPAFGAVAGTLRTASGAPLANSYVDLEGKGRSAYTNAAGAYAFADVPPGPYRVRAFDSTRSNVMRTADVVVTAGDTAAADFAFPPVGTVQVTVRAGGTAVTGVALRWRSDARGPDFVCCASTDALGKVTFTNVVGPDVLVQAGNPSPSAYVRGQATATVAEGQVSTVTLDVPGAGTVTGTIRSRDGLALPGHGVYALHATDPVTWSSTTSDGSGAFSLGYVIEGAFRLQGRRYTYYPAVGSVDTRAEVRGTLSGQGATVALDALAPLGALAAAGQGDFWEIDVAAGQDVDVLAVGAALGARPALADPHLAIYAPDGTLLGENEDISPTDHNARVHATAGAPGRYVLVVRGAAGQTGGYELVSPTHVLRAYAGATLGGTVTRDLDGAPAAGQAVRVTPSGLTVVTAADGRYVAPLLLAGSDPAPVTAQALDAESVVVAEATASATPGQDATIDLVVPVREAVTVTVRRGSLPLAGATVSLSSDHAGARPEDRLRQRVTGTDGLVTTTLPVGNVTAEVTDSGAAYSAAGVLGEGAPLALEVVVPPGVTALHGTVRAGDGVTPLAGAAVELSGVGAATTDAAGVYRFDAVPAGTYTLTARVGTTAVPFDLTLTGGDVDHDFVLPVGFVAGRVSNASNVSVGGANVTATATNGTFTGTTGGDGRYRIAGIAPGAVDASAIDSATGATGSRAGTLAAAGQTLTLDVTVQLVGTVTGTVFRTGGTTPASAVEVRLLSTGLTQLLPTVLTDAQGHYSFAGVPLGGFYVDVTDPANGDRGRVSSQLVSSGETRTVNVILIGVGRVVVTVVDTSSHAVAGAEVTVQTQTGLAPSRTGSTAADGTLVLDNVLAGGIGVTAHDPLTNLSGSNSATVPAGGSVQVTVTLQPAGTLQGRVLVPGGGAGIAGAEVRLLYYWGGLARDADSGTDGSFRFDAVPLGTYTLDVVWMGRLRAHVTNLTLSADGQVITHDLELVGLGTVHGTVFNPGGSRAAFLSVTLRSSNAQLGGTVGASTDASGAYEFTNVPVGAFSVSAVSGTDGAEVPGLMPDDGQDVTVDVQLLNNTVSLPRTLYDANNSPFSIQPDGSVVGGTNSVYYGDFGNNRGAFLLDLVSGGTASRYAPTATLVPTEQAQREIVTTQTGLAGLDVTRKVFVPQAGYLARYLEILRNPGTSPVTVDVRLTSNIRQFNGLPQVIATSSGDAQLSVANPATADHWVVLDDTSDGDPFLVSTLPATAFVFDGPGAAQAASSATWSVLPSSGLLAYQWTGVTVGPGQTVAFLHFGVQQTSRAAAQASAARLVQLPPEVLDGLSLDEIAAVRNFAVPADGSSAVTPLPAVAGTITGRLLGGDATTPVPSANVTFKSHNVLFGRTFTSSVDSLGRFTFATQWSSFGSSVAIPADEFGLVGHLSELASPEAVGSFAPGSLAATQDVVFTNAGAVRGTLTRWSGLPAPNASVSLYQSSPYFFVSTSTAADGSFGFPAVPGGTLSLSAAWYPPAGGSPLQATATVSVTPPQTTTVTLVLPPTGRVTGTVTTASGSAASSVYVRLSNASLSRQVYTDGAGSFSFDDVPEGDFTLGATEPSTGVETVATVTVTRDQTTTRDLVLTAVGQVTVHVRLAGGAAAGDAQVYIDESQRGYFRFVGWTDGGGDIPITAVSAGAFTVRAYHPQNTAVYAETTGTLSVNGSTVPVTVTLPAMGTVHATVLRGTAPVPGVAVYVRPASVGYFSYGGTTDSAGTVTIPYVPQGPFTAQTSVEGLVVEATGQVVTDGATVEVVLALPDNPIGLPALLYDANAFDFVVQPNGTFDGFYQALAGDSYLNRGASRLDVIVEGAATSFTGGPVGSLEVDRRQIVIGQSDLAGLSVTRKVLVPRGGYFARYVDVLRNPGPTPVTVDVRLASHLAPYWGVPHVVATSSGDDVLGVAGPGPADRWVTVDDGQDEDPFEQSNAPALGFVFGGEGATASASEAAFEPGTDFSRVSFRWNAVTIPAGGSVAYLHFDVQETSRAAAATAAERLSHLPPEALDGLTAEERAAVVNFAIPADGSSPLERVVAVDGIVTGLVLGGDHETVVPGASVRLHNLYPLFGRTYAFQSDASGVYVAASRLDDGSPPVAVPRDAFELRATHPVTGIEAAPTLGSFTPGEGTVFQDIVFSATGVLRGTVRRHDQGPVDSGSVVLSRAGGTTYQGSIASDGTYAMTGLPPGPYTVTGRLNNGLAASVAATVSVGEAAVADVVLPATGTVTGIVRTASGGNVGSTYVVIGDGAGYQDATYTESGQFTFTDVPVGVVSLQAVQPGYGWYAGPFPATVAEGQVTSVSLRLDAVANVHVRVTNRDGSPLVSAPVYLRPRGQDYFQYRGSTDASGSLLITSVREGPFAIQAISPTTFAFFGSSEGTVTAGDDGATLEAAITAGARGRVQGRVTAGDGATPLIGFFVEVMDAVSGAQVGYAYTDADGNYAVDGVAAGPRGFVVRAQYNGVEGSGTGVLAADGDTATIDVVVPVSVVRGTVTFADGEPVPYPTVFVVPAGQAGGTVYGQGEPDGRFLVIGTPAGPFRLSAQDSDSGLSGSVESELVSVAVPVEVDVVLAPSGTVSGHVRDEHGAPMPGLDVVLSHPALEFDRYLATDGSGAYRVDRVALGSFLLEACQRDDQGEVQRCGRAEGRLTAAGDTVTVDVVLPALAPLTGTVRAADGSVLAGAVVTAESESGLGLLGVVEREAIAGDDGTYAFAGFPAGPVRVSAHPDDDRLDAGLTRATLPAGGAAVDVTIGNATRFDHALDGSDGWRYDVRCDGTLGRGGRADGSILSSFAVYSGGGVRVDVDGTVPRCRVAEALTADGRGIDFDPSPSRTLQLQRKVFVPAGGGFVRDLEIVTNLSGLPATASVTVNNAHPYYDYDRGQYVDAPYTAVAPSETGGTYAIVAQASGASQAVVASVFAGPGGRTPVAEASFDSYSYYHDYRWDITVPAHGTVALLHFTTQGTPNDVASAQARAQALVDLSDPDALAGLTDDEVEEILNFAVPAAGDRTGLKGHVLSADGAAVEGASVGVRAADGTTVATAATAADGHFRVTPLSPGAYTVVAEDLAAGKSAQVDVEVVAGAVADVTLTLPAGQGIQGVVQASDGTPVAGAAVTLFRDSGEQAGQATGDAAGRFAFSDLEAGSYTVIASDSGPAGHPGRTDVYVPAGHVAAVVVSLLADDAVGGVHVHGVIESTGAPAAFATVNVEVDGWFQSVFRQVTLDGAGQATVGGLPVGLVFATTGMPPDYGWATALVPAAGTADLELRVGSRPAFPIDLTGTDGLPYFARASSVLAADGTTSDWECPVFCVGYSSLYTTDGVNHEYHQQAGALLSSGGREVTVGPDFLGPIRATRRTYVPPAGRFARFFDVFENTSSEPVPLTYYVEQAHDSPGAPWTVGTTSSGDEVFDAADEYATMSSTTSTSPAMAFVVAGPGVSLARSPYTATSDPWTWFVDMGNFVLDPGQKVAILRFVVQRPHGQTAEVEAQAEALRGLTDPEALTGLSAAERALVINFIVPEPTP